MLGAIIGDIVGSRFEFKPTNDYDFELFGPGCDFTDDTICTIAIADSVLNTIPYSKSVHEWCRRYPTPKGGYGGSFAQWVRSDAPAPYYSFGNGAAMRVSSIGWLYNNIYTVSLEAAASAMISHNHIEGQRGAECIACCVLLARYGYSKKEIIDHAYKMFGYDISKDKLSKYKNRFDETCQGTIPAALLIIKKSNSFEDAIRRAVSLGADADTLAAIVGSIAEAIWGIPEDIKQQALTFLPKEMLDVYNQFLQATKK